MTGPGGEERGHYPNSNELLMKLTTETEPRQAYPKVLTSPDEIQKENGWFMQLVEQQSIDLDIAPLRAHRNAAIFAFALGSAFAVGRGLVFACTLPAGSKRLLGGLLVANAAGKPVDSQHKFIHANRFDHMQRPSTSYPLQ
jgi:hypothetical protein